MNKKILTTAMLLPMLFVVASCNKANNPMGYKINSNSVITTKMLEQNAKEMTERFHEEIVDDTFYKTVEKHYNVDSDITIEESIVGTGCVVVSDKDGKKGIYSFILDKFIVEPKFEDTDLLKVINPDNYEGKYSDITFIYGVKENYVLIADLFGHKVLELNSNLNSEPVLKFKSVNNVDYLKVSYVEKDLTKVEKYYKYDKDENLISVDEIPNYDDELLDEDDSKLHFEYDEAYNKENAISLKDYGYDGYSYIDDSKIITVYNDKNEVINKFDIDEDFALIGNNLYYQKFYEVDRKSEDYEYCDGINKYNIDTVKIDLISGKTSTFDVNFIVHDAIPYMDENGIYNYAILDITEIDEDKLSDDYHKEVLVNKDASVLENVTGLYLDSLVKYGENYLNLETGIFYDSNFKEINSTDNDVVRATFLEPKIIVEYAGRSILLDANTNVILDDNYYNINVTEKGKYAFASTILDTKVINLETLETIATINNNDISTLRSSVLIESNDNGYKLFTTDGLMLSSTKKLTDYESDFSTKAHQPYGGYLAFLDEDSNISVVGLKSNPDPFD